METYFGVAEAEVAYVGAGFEIVLRQGFAVHDISTWATTGMSNTLIKAPGLRHRVGVEIVFAAMSQFRSVHIAVGVAQIAAAMLERGKAPPFNTILHLARPLYGSRVIALVVYSPILWPDEAATVSDSKPPVHVVQLLPLIPEECSFAHVYGFEALRRYLLDNDIDVTDLGRPPGPALAQAPAHRH